MHKKPLIISLIVLALVGGSVAYLLASSGAKDSKNQMLEQTQVPTSPAQTTAAAGGSYVDYTTEAIANTTGTKVLFFHAPWCPQCRDLETDIKEKGVPEGVTIIKVDYDTNRSLRQKYGVTLQTTFVKVDDNGELVSKFVAYDDPTLESVKKNIL